MKAFLLAAGLGTRLLPLTEDKPKALVEINGKTLLELAVTKLKRHGFNQIIINVHHFSDKIIDYLQKKNNFDIEIEISDERDLLLDTGGGLKKVSWFFHEPEPFLIYNVDILSDIDLNELYEFHKTADAIITLAVQQRNDSRCFIFNDENVLIGWTNRKTHEEKITREPNGQKHLLSFSGIHVVDPKIFELMPDENVFSIIDLYLNVSAKYNITSFMHDDSIWHDVGKKESLTIPENELKELGFF